MVQSSHKCRPPQPETTRLQAIDAALQTARVPALKMILSAIDASLQSLEAIGVGLSACIALYEAFALDSTASSSR